MKIWLSLLALAAGAALLTAAAFARPNDVTQAVRVQMPSLFFSGLPDPALSTSEWDWEVSRATCLGLVAYNGARFELRPEAAAAMPRVSRDGKRLDFTVRAGFTRFSNGAPVSARSFERTIERVAEPAVASPGRFFVKDLARVDTRGAHLIVRLKRAVPDFVARMALPFFCAVPASTPHAQLVRPVPSAGPYFISKSDEYYQPWLPTELSPNPYYQGSRGRGTVTISLAGFDPFHTCDEIVAGRLDVASDWYCPDIDTTPYRRSTRPLEARYLLFNTRRGPFANLRLRKAAALALDRTELARTAWPQGTAYDHFVPPGVPGWRPAHVFALTRTDGALRRARALADGLVPAKATVLANCWPRYDRGLFDTMKRALADIDIEVDLQIYGDSSMCPWVLAREEDDLRLGEWVAYRPDPAEFLRFVAGAKQPFGRTLSPPNFTPAKTAWLRQVDRASRLRGRMRTAALARLDVRLARDATPAAALYYATRSNLFSTRVGCIHYSSLYGLDLAALCLKN